MSEHVKGAPASPVMPGSPPIALRLPDEMWIKILDRLSYNEIVRDQRICKKIHRLVQDKRFDGKLFRRGVGGKLKQGAKLKLHPIMDQVDCVRVTKDEVLIFCYSASSNGEGSKDFNGYDYPAAQAFVTSPACKSLEISMFEDWGHGRTETFVVKDAQGVKVEKALKAIARFWAEDVPPRMTAQVRRPGGWGKDEKITRVHCLGDHSFFEGWHIPSVRKGETVYLEARSFGS
ncbi:hypothetical protein JCM10449v2_007276 [Rhodotorula kratochvilovae]